MSYTEVPGIFSHFLLQITQIPQTRLVKKRKVLFGWLIFVYSLTKDLEVTSSDAFFLEESQVEDVT